MTALQVSRPAYGTLTLNTDSSFLYTPAPSFNGAAQPDYQARDGTADSNVATVTITVTPPSNDAPSVVANTALRECRHA